MEFEFQLFTSGKQITEIRIWVWILEFQGLFAKSIILILLLKVKHFGTFNGNPTAIAHIGAINLICASKSDADADSFNSPLIVES